MENFVVSARKYRPSTFDMVVGQNSITTTLKNAIRNDQLAQAFLFCGPRGVGKTTCARILAKTINCTNLTPDIEPCNECDACRSFNVSASFNIHELDAASNNKVEDIRSLVEQVRIPPQGVKYKVYIIDEVHMLSQAAFNAFLKTLEEPPPYAKFILATTEKHKILPTIISRCQVFDFRRINADDMAKQMAYVAKNESIEADVDALHLIAQKADGSMRDALSIFDQIVSFAGTKLTYQSVIDNLNILDFEYYFRITDFLLDGNVPSALLLFNDIIENGFDGQYFLSGLGQHFRNLLVAQDQNTIKLLEVGENLKNRYLQQSLRCSNNFLLKSLELFSQSDFNYKESNNKRLLVELTLARSCAIMKSFDNVVSSVSKEQLSQSQDLPKAQAPVSGLSNFSNETKKVESDTNHLVEDTKPIKPSTKPVTKVTSTVEIPGTISIKDVIEKANAETVDKPQAEVENLPEQDFTQDELNNVWDKYKEQFVETDGNLHTTLNCRKPELKEGYKIEFFVDNKVQQKSLNKNLNEIHEFLRKELNNYKILLEVEVTENDTTIKPFTANEKYKKFVEKNPAVEKLKNQLDLNLDA